MLFNSIEFAIFFPICFIIYWFILGKNLKIQNLFVVGSSYLFYGWWDWRFLSLIAFSTLLDFSIGVMLSKTSDSLRRKLLLATSVVINLGFLGFFKYYNFFIDSLVDSFTFFGSAIHPNRLNIILPVGISFYTFQTLSYTIDVYQKKLQPTSNFISFAAFVSFFPQLVAGPIERATHLLPQFYKPRKFDYSQAVLGIKLMVWGFFKKIVIADTCAQYVDVVQGDVNGYSWLTLFMSGILFSFQIYGDFSGYSDIARGLAKLFGFDLMINFKYPYFSRDVAEFWRRWHISLSTWFRDYLYVPLGGSKKGLAKSIRNTFIIFLVSGFWHGANWTFVIWGFLHALAFLPLLLRGRNRNHLNNIENDRLTLRTLAQIIGCFLMVSLFLVFFRADSVSEAMNYIGRTISFSNGVFEPVNFTLYIPLLLMIVIEWFGKDLECPLDYFEKRVVFYPVLTFVFVICLFYFDSNNNSFIYFQF